MLLRHISIFQPLLEKVYFHMTTHDREHSEYTIAMYVLNSTSTFWQDHVGVGAEPLSTTVGSACSQSTPYAHLRRAQID